MSEYLGLENLIWTSNCKSLTTLLEFYSRVGVTLDVEGGIKLQKTRKTDYSIRKILYEWEVRQTDRQTDSSRRCNWNDEAVMCKLLNMYKFAHTRPSPRLSLSLYQSQCPHIALINSQLQNNFTNLGPLKLQSKWFEYYWEIWLAGYT